MKIKERFDIEPFKQDLLELAKFYELLSKANDSRFHELAEACQKTIVALTRLIELEGVESDCNPDDVNHTCELCCEHGDVDDFTCLICDKDMTEEIMSRAYDQAKDRRKYGDD